MTKFKNLLPYLILTVYPRMPAKYIPVAETRRPSWKPSMYPESVVRANVGTVMMISTVSKITMIRATRRVLKPWSSMSQPLIISKLTILNIRASMKVLENIIDNMMIVLINPFIITILIDMIKNVQIYFQTQLSYLALLLLFFVAPLVVIYELLPFEVPNIQYAALGALFVFQYIFYNEKKFRKKIEPKVTKLLSRELGRIPAHKEINRRLHFVVICRGISVAIACISIFSLMVLYGQF